MAKKESSASRTVASAMRRRKSGTLKSGSGQRVRSRKQAIAIGLNEARAKGADVPEAPGGRSRGGRSRASSSRRSSSGRSGSRTSASPTSASRTSASRTSASRKSASGTSAKRSRTGSRRTGRGKA